MAVFCRLPNVDSGMQNKKQKKLFKKKKKKEVEEEEKKQIFFFNHKSAEKLLWVYILLLSLALPLDRFCDAWSPPGVSFIYHISNWVHLYPETYCIETTTAGVHSG